MSVTSALTATLTGTAQSAGKGGGVPAAGAEAFAGVMADLQAPPMAMSDCTGAIGPASGTDTGIDNMASFASADASLEGKGPPPIARRKRAVKDESPEAPVAVVLANLASVSITAQPATAAAIDPAVSGGKADAAVPVSSRKIAKADSGPPVDQAEQPETAVMTPFLTTTPAKSAQPQGQPEALVSIASTRTDSAPSPDSRNAPQDGQTRQEPAAARSRNGVDQAPVSLTAVADIVQNLPPIVQSQLSPVVPGDAVAVRAATDVGAILDGQVIDMGVGGQWIDRVAKEITALAQGSGHSRFQLSPPNLGRLQIDVWQGEGGGRVQLLTETDEAAQRLRQDQAGLQADARLSALSLDRIVIDRAPGAFGASQDQGAQSGAGRQDMADRSGGQAGNQTAAQNGGNGGSAAGQGKAPIRRDVFNERTQADAQDGRPSSRSDDRHVRYA